MYIELQLDEGDVQMRGVVQRVIEAQVDVNGETIGKIGRGILLFLGVGEGDELKDVDYLVEKIIGLRIFEDENNKMNLSLEDISGELLVISQFTLYGDVRKGKRPSFTESASPDMAEKLYLDFIEKSIKKGIKTEKGVFGADMKVGLINDGPVTILLDSKKLF